MSKTYGTITTDKGQSTRTGNEYVIAAAQTFDGSVSVSLKPGKDGVWVTICAEEGSTSHPGHMIWNGNLSDLLHPHAQLVHSIFGGHDL